MSKDLNQCNFIGRLGKDIDMRYSPSGSAVANFSIACNDDYKDKTSGQNVEQTNWINIVAFGKLAETMGQYLHKGSKVYISGKQRTRKWQAQDGQDKYTTEIVANEMQMLDSRQSDQGQPSSNGPSDTPQTNGGTAGAADFDDDIPFDLYQKGLVV